MSMAPRDEPPALRADEAEAYDEQGVDLTLLRWMLSLSPAERLDYLQQMVDEITRARGG